MGIFQKLFGGNMVDRLAAERMKDHYESCMAGAKNYVDSSVCRRDPPNCGDWLLEQQNVNPSIASFVQRLLAEGVTENDIRWWWNLPPIEAGYILAETQHFIDASFMAFLLQGMPPDQAAAKVRKGHVFYFTDSSEQSGVVDDRPIRIELRERIMQYMERQRLGSRIK